MKTPPYPSCRKVVGWNLAYNNGRIKLCRQHEDNHRFNLSDVWKGQAYGVCTECIRIWEDQNRVPMKEFAQFLHLVAAQAWQWTFGSDMSACHFTAYSGGRSDWLTNRLRMF